MGDSEQSRGEPPDKTTQPVATSAVPQESHEPAHKRNVILQLCLFIVYLLVLSRIPFFSTAEKLDSHVISAEILLISLVFVIASSLLQYFNANFAAEGSRERWGLITMVVTLMLTFGAAVWVAAFLVVPICRPHLQTYLEWPSSFTLISSVFPYPKNLLVSVIAGLVLIGDWLLFTKVEVAGDFSTKAKALFSSGLKNDLVYLDIIILLSLIGTSWCCAHIHKAFSDANFHQGFNAGVLAFHMALGVLLFEVAQPQAIGSNKTSKKGMKKRLIIGGIGIGILLAVTVWYGAKRKSTTPEIKVGIATWAGFGVGYLGDAESLFPNLRMSFRVLDDVNARHAAFRSGELDAMVSSADVFAQELAQGIDGQIVLVTDESTGGDGIIARNGIATIGDLKGKRIAFARATPSHFLLFKLLQKNGMTVKDISPVTFDDPSQAAQAFSGGSVDAAVTFEPFLSQLEHGGKGKVIVTTKELPGIIVDVLVASPKFIERQADLDTLISGWIKSAEFAKANPAKAATIIANSFRMREASDVEGMIAGLTFADAKRNRELLCRGTDKPPLNQILTEAAEFWKEQGIISQLPSFNGRVSERACELLK